MLFEKIYQIALPSLKVKRIKEVRIGLGLLAVELNDSSLGVSYVLRDELPLVRDGKKVTLHVPESKGKHF